MSDQMDILSCLNWLFIKLETNLVKMDDSVFNNLLTLLLFAYQEIKLFICNYHSYTQ